LFTQSVSLQQLPATQVRLPPTLQQKSVALALQLVLLVWLEQELLTHLPVVVLQIIDGP
jgi:hypothetical protein